eukprot:gene4175-biopygen1537
MLREAETEGSWSDGLGVSKFEWRSLRMLWGRFISPTKNHPGMHCTENNLPRPGITEHSQFIPTILILLTFLPQHVIKAALEVVIVDPKDLLAARVIKMILNAELRGCCGGLGIPPAR